MLNKKIKLKIPKYKYIAKSIIEKIKEGNLSKGDILGSLNSTAQEFSVSKDTVVKAYEMLRSMNIIDSIHGKAFYIKNDYIEYDKKIFILFDVLHTPYKEVLYKGIIDNIGDRIYLDFYFHNCKPDLFKRLLEENIGDFDYYVVMPFTNPNIIVLETLQKMDQKKLLLLDINVDYEGKKCSVIYQSHDGELEKALCEGISLIKKYSEMVLVFPENKHHPIVIKNAFLRFCKKHRIKSYIINETKKSEIRKDAVYMVIEDDDLSNIVRISRKNNYSVGKDIGIISYNETPLKELIENGITTVSVDFYEMGRKTAELLNKNGRVNILQPTKLIIRNSL